MASEQDEEGPGAIESGEFFKGLVLAIPPTIVLWTLIFFGIRWLVQ